MSLTAPAGKRHLPETGPRNGHLRPGRDSRACRQLSHVAGVHPFPEPGGLRHHPAARPDGGCRSDLLHRRRVLGGAAFLLQDQRPSSRAQLLSTTFFLVLALSTLGALTLAAFSPWIWKYGLKEAGKPWFIMLAAANFAAGTLMTMPLNFAQTTQRARLYLGFSLTKLVMQLSLNILFVVVFKLGVAGLLLSTLPLTCSSAGLWRSGCCGRRAFTSISRWCATSDASASPTRSPGPGVSY